MVIMLTSPLKAALMGAISVVIVGWIRASSRMGPRRIFQALCAGMMGMQDIATSCALAGIIVGVFSLTGLGHALHGRLRGEELEPEGRAPLGASCLEDDSPSRRTSPFAGRCADLRPGDHADLTA